MFWNGFVNVASASVCCFSDDTFTQSGYEFASALTAAVRPPRARHNELLLPPEGIVLRLILPGSRYVGNLLNGGLNFAGVSALLPLMAMVVPAKREGTRTYENTRLKISQFRGRMPATTGFRANWQISYW